MDTFKKGDKVIINFDLLQSKYNGYGINKALFDFSFPDSKGIVIDLPNFKGDSFRLGNCVNDMQFLIPSDCLKKDTFKKGDKVIIDLEIAKENHYFCIGIENFNDTYPDLKGVVEYASDSHCMVSGKRFSWALPVICLKKQD